MKETDNISTDVSDRPALKDRKEDIMSLATGYIKLAQEQAGTGPKTLSPEAADYLLSYEWPGNEQELEVAVKRACILSDDTTLYAEDFNLKQRQAKSVGKFIEGRLKGYMRNIKKFESFNLYGMVIPEVEKSLIEMVLKETKGNQIRASKLLGINRNTLRGKIRKLGIRIR